MRHSALWLLFSALLPYGSTGKPTRPACRCLSYQPCWPSTSEFSQLESQLSQPLIKPVPPASVCYPPSSPTSANCTAVQEHLTDAKWRSDLPGSTQLLNFESYIFKNGTLDACYYNTTLGLPCHQGNIPVLGVEAKEISDVQATVKFAKRHNLRLIIKNTGHDFLGRSVGRGGFMLWTHNLKNISYDDHFVPDGAPPQGQSYKAITLGAGVQWVEAYAAVNASGRFMIGGLSGGGSIGAAGGWLLGGGHSPFSPKHGLGVDNAIQFTVVLASGKYVTANQYQNTDLFWALRGGGGGTFGVVISVTYRTYEIFPFSAVRLVANFSTPEVALDVTTEFIKLHPTLSDANWSGYSTWANDSISMSYFAPDISLQEANATLLPFINYVNSAVKNPQKDVLVQMGAVNSFYELYVESFNIPSGSGGYVEFTSRLMSRDKVVEDPASVAKLTLALGVSFSFVAGGAVAQVDPDSVAVNPAWRKALGVLTGGASWDEGTPVSVIEQLRQDALDKLNKYLDKVSPDSGTYFNEASLYEKDPKKTFFGSHYMRLREIKKAYDPDDLFLVAEGVGSDDWDKSLHCRLR